MLVFGIWSKYFWISCPQVNATGPHWWYMDVCLGNGLVLSGNKWAWYILKKGVKRLFFLLTYLPLVPHICVSESGPTFIKPDQLDPWIKDQMKITLLSTVSPLQLPNFVSCGRDKPSHMTQNLVTVGTKLWTTERFLVDPWSMDQADLVW